VALAALLIAILALAGVAALLLRSSAGPPEGAGERLADLEDRLSELEAQRAIETVERAAARRARS
jgi:hypothetical protein